MAIGEIADYFNRVEFQKRRSLHIHGLFWVKEAPQSVPVKKLFLPQTRNGRACKLTDAQECQDI